MKLLLTTIIISFFALTLKAKNKGVHDCQMIEIILSDTATRKFLFIDKIKHQTNLYNPDKYFSNCPVVYVKDRRHEIYSEDSKYRSLDTTTSNLLLLVKTKSSNKIEVSITHAGTGNRVEIDVIIKGDKRIIGKAKYWIIDK